MSQSINIIKLIEENPNTKLSKSYHGKLINKLKDNFSTEEQQLFISSFYCHLNYKPTDFVIDLDDIWSWLGYTKKDKAKDLLEKYFKIEVDYKRIFPDSRDYSQIGRPKEKIMLNTKTFKKMCLKANKSKANEIHEYYIMLEETLYELINEESNELRLQLEIKENELQERKEKLKLLEKSSLQNVLYILTNKYLAEERIFIVGKTFNKISEYEVVYQRQCNNAKEMNLIEKILLYKLYKYRETVNRGDRYILPEEFDISLFIKVIDDVCNVMNSDREGVVIKRINDDDKDKELDAAYYRENKEEIDKKNKIYHEENKDKILVQRKQYYDKNIEVIRAKDRARNPKVICDCGLSICKRSLGSHQKSKTHERFMKGKTNDVINLEEEEVENDEI